MLRQILETDFFSKSRREIEVPQSLFSLISQGDAEIVTALRGRCKESIVSIIKQLSSTEGVRLSPQDINELLKRREVLEMFRKAVRINLSPKVGGKIFSMGDKWIFGYGLNYQILRQEEDTAVLWWTWFYRTGGQRGDYLRSTMEISISLYWSR